MVQWLIVRTTPVCTRGLWSDKGSAGDQSRVCCRAKCLQDVGAHWIACVPHRVKVGPGH